MLTRGLLVIAVVAFAATVARASTIVVMSEPARAGELGSALQVTLAGRGVAIATVPAPDGALRLDRAAAAQRAAIMARADIAVWIDADAQAIDVCAVSSDGRYFRHAPLPQDGGSARLFAAIATSLVDELIAPPDAGFDVHVDVRIEPKGAAAIAPAGFAPPGFVPVEYPAPAIAESTEIVRPNKTLFEIGPMMSPLTLGIEAELAFPVGSNIRFGVGGILNMGFEDTVVIGGGMLEVRHVGRGMRHWDLGVVGGGVTLLASDSGGEGDSIGFVGFRIARAWEGPGRGTAFSLTPLVATDGDTTIPGVYAALHWMIPL